MIERTLYAIAFSSSWGRQMRFITGPRQTGKTTLAKEKLIEEHTQKLYYLWDLRSVRSRYKNEELFFTTDIPPHKDKKSWVCFDEIHKMPAWKNILKGVFDETQDHYQFIITGSAKLNVLKKAGDSLSGRYFTFHLYPLTLREVIGNPKINPKEFSDPISFILSRLENSSSHQAALDRLIGFSGFPEPYSHHSVAFLNKWSQDYLDRVITEDIGALTRVTDRERLHDLYRLLPEMSGSPLSVNSLASLLESNAVTIKNYLKKLEDFYLAFRITPYTRNIKRSLLKSSKWYVYDWTRFKDPFKRFENYVAVELNTMTSLWTDLTGVHYKLFYVRDKEKKETDFLILKEGKPWLMIEAKYSDMKIDSHHLQTSRVLGNIPIVQVCYEKGIAFQESKNVFRISAERFFR